MSVTSWDERQLCPDGACIGVIGPNGQCRECGKVAPNWGDERRRGLEDDGAVIGDRGAHGGERIVADGGDEDDDYDGDGDGEDGDDDAADDDDIGGDGVGNGVATREPARDGDEWETRSLCPDEACIGVIGASGTCGVCGKSRA